MAHWLHFVVRPRHYPGLQPEPFGPYFEPVEYSAEDWVALSLIGKFLPADCGLG
jgi:hypothetical protein